MTLRTTLLAALLAFGVSALIYKIDHRGATPTPSVAAPEPVIPASGVSYSSLLVELDQRIDSLQGRADDRQGDWLIRTHLARALLERAGLTNRIEDFARVQVPLEEAFAVAAAVSGPQLLAARFNFAIHRLAAAEAHLDRMNDQVLQRDEDRIAAHLLRAEIAAQRGQYEAALAGFTEVARAAPQFANAELALYHAKTGNPDEAAALLEGALAATIAGDPRRRAWLRLQLGILAMNRGEFQVALKHLQGADAELAGWWLVREHVAEIHIRRSQHDEAIAIYEELVRSADLPQHMDALAGLYRHKGDPQKAEALIARAAARWDEQLARFPESAVGHALQHHLQFGAPARALELALANHAARPGGDAKVALASAYLKMGQPAEALAVAEQALATPYRTARLHDVAAKAHAALGDTKAAEAQIALCYAINPMYTSEEHAH